MDINDLNRSDLIASGEIINLERAIQDKDGTTHIILVNVKLVSIKGGTMLITCRDITERKRAHVELQESEERYRQLFDNASDAVMIFDAHSKHFEDANSAAADLFGYTKDEFAKLTVEDISPQKDNAMIAAGKVGAGISGNKYAHLHYFKKKNGTVYSMINGITIGLSFSHIHTQKSPNRSNIASTTLIHSPLITVLDFYLLPVLLHH